MRVRRGLAPELRLAAPLRAEFAVQGHAVGQEVPVVLAPDGERMVIADKGAGERRVRAAEHPLVPDREAVAAIRAETAPKLDAELTGHAAVAAALASAGPLPQKCLGRASSPQQYFSKTM